MSKRKCEEIMMGREITEIKKRRSYGDGEKWVRGPMISVAHHMNDDDEFGSSSISVFLATVVLKKRRLEGEFLTTFIEVKSGELLHDSGMALAKERFILDELRGCPYIRRCYGEEITVDDLGNKVYNLLLEHSSGGTLAEKIRTTGSGKGLSEAEVRVYTRNILLGLAWIHDRDYAFRDLSPENIMLFTTKDQAGTISHVAKIGECGSAETMGRITRTLHCWLRGRMKYVSPEAARWKKQGKESDVWAVGCIVMEMLTGKSLWDDGEMGDGEIKWNLFQMEILASSKRKGEKRVVEAPLPRGISKMAEKFLRACLAIRVDQRWDARRLLNLSFVSKVTGV